MQSGPTHVRRRSRVSITVLPDGLEADEQEKPLLHDIQDSDESDEALPPMQPNRRPNPQVGDTLRERSGAAPRPVKPAVLGRVVALFLIVTAISCFVTAALVYRREGAVPWKPQPRESFRRRPRLACDPYDQFGVLNVSQSTPSENVWQPIAASEDCQPVNYLDLLANMGSSPMIDARLEFLRSRTLVLYGDSIDRNHVDHMCSFIGGRYELILAEHPLSPPYPAGFEVPPEGYRNPDNGKREWPSNGLARPYICHIPRLDARIINVFHFGFQNLSDWLLSSPHYYPPFTVEDRFDQVVVPLVANIAAHYGSKPNPDLVSVAPGFWTLLRETIDKQLAVQSSVPANLPFEEIKALWRNDVWRTPSQHSRTFYETRISSILRRVASAWPEQESSPRPSLLWRAPHFVKETDRTPYNRLVAVDQIGRSVVSRLQDEAEAARMGVLAWNAWKRSAPANSAGFGSVDRSWARKLQLDVRLKVDEWGARMLGQNQHFKDDIHPNPLPGSYLYGNMLFHHLWAFDHDRQLAT